MNTLEPITALDTLSAHLLKLGRVAREVPASRFLSQAVQIVREVIPFRRGWWGLVADQGADKAPGFILHAEYIDLPPQFASEWRVIGSLDTFAGAVRHRRGEVQRFVSGVRDDTPEAVLEFDRRYELHSGMGMMLDDASTGNRFFIALFRSASDAPFSDQEATLFLHLLRHTLQLWHHSLQDALSTASKENIARAALAHRNGRLYYAGPELCELLYKQWPAWDGLKLPDEVVSRFDAIPCHMRLPYGVIDISARSCEHVWLVRTDPGAVTPLLSPRERRVAHLFAAGHSYKEIALQLELTPATVRTYLRDAYLRLGVKNKVQLGTALGVI